MLEYPLISVIVLTYNNFEYVYETLDSILAQNYPCIELIISDDGSSEFTRHKVEIEGVIDKYKKDNVVAVVFNETYRNRGTVKNANSAIERSRGTYIKFISPGDKLLGVDCLLVYAQLAIAGKAAVVAARTLTMPLGIKEAAIIERPSMLYRLKARNGRLPLVVPTKKDIDRLSKISDSAKKNLLMSRCIISTPAVFYSREVFTKYGCFSVAYRLLEDMPTWPLLAKQGARICFSDRVLTSYLLNGISNSKEPNQEFIAEYCKVIREIYIPNDTRFGAFAPFNRKLRVRCIEYEEEKSGGGRSGKMTDWWRHLRYLDCVVARLCLGLKYLLFDTKI